MSHENGARHEAIILDAVFDEVTPQHIGRVIQEHGIGTESTELLAVNYPQWYYRTIR
jgi:hypothetical protein